jgi:type IV secretion system protein VirB10
MDPEPTRPGVGVETAADATRSRADIHDRRVTARGALPRHVQTWIMLGLACLILVVILLTGQPASRQPVSMPQAAVQPATVQPERVRSFQESLAERERRLRDAQVALPSDSVAARSPARVAPAAVDPLLDERRRRDEQSLFADNVAFTRRGSGTPSTATPPAPTLTAPWPYPGFVPVPMSVPPASSLPTDAAGQPRDQGPRATVLEAVTVPEPLASPGTSGTATEPGPQHTLIEGTVIESVLINRLDGTFQGPVQCLVTAQVYSHDRQAIVIPAGARVLGSAAPVQAWGDRRLAVRFHRLVFPDGRTVTLESFTGLNQVGETGLTDEVDRHYVQVFGASLAIGAISGLAQFGTRAGYDMTAVDASRQAAGTSLATSTARVLDRYLNVLPTITIREGHRVKIVLTNDLHLPAYPLPGGSR